MAYLCGFFGIYTYDDIYIILTFNQGVRGSNPRWFTKEKARRYHIFSDYLRASFYVFLNFDYLGQNYEKQTICGFHCVGCNNLRWV